ncbi:MAG TPA: PIN domain-containing protein [Candidatus Angelobacter sp.]
MVQTGLGSVVSGRILHVDRQVANQWASLVAKTVQAGRPLPTVDSLIAATALAHDLTIVTRNVRDFQYTGASTINPWQSP